MPVQLRAQTQTDTNSNMNKLCVILGLCLLVALDLQAQSVAVKTNLLYDATTTPSVGVEVGFHPHFSADLSANYNGWTLGGGKSLKHWLVQPEVRYWIHESFNGHYFGLHAHYLDYDFGGTKLPFGMDKRHRYDGNGYGVGISYGYQLYLSPRWNIEFTLGGGYTHFEYDKYDFPKAGDKIGKFRNQYWGLTKAGISIVYILR